MLDDAAWSVPVRLAEMGRGTLSLKLEADSDVRGRIARLLKLVRLESFIAQVAVKPWLDGAEINGRWTADITQTCGISLDDFDTRLAGDFVLRVVPPTSKLAQPDDAETIIDPNADDPPDVLDGDVIEVGGVLVEQLALEVDPFPRKPDAAFVPPDPGPEISPFAVLRTLKPSDKAR